MQETEPIEPQSEAGPITSTLAKFAPWFIPLLGILGVSLVLIYTHRYGAGVTPDSADYIAAARSFQEGAGFVHWEGKPFTSWPPLFPIVLGLLGFLGIDPLIGTRILNALCFGGVAASVGWMANRLIPNPWLVIAAMASILLMPTISGISMFALSEALFLLLALWTVWILPKSITQSTWGSVIATGMLCGFSILTRNVGGILWIIGVAMFLGYPQALSYGKRIGRTVVFSILSLGPYALWLVRNAMISGTLSGGREGTDRTFLMNFGYIVEIFIEWMMPQRLPFVMQAAGVLVVCGLVIWGMALGFRSQKTFSSAFRVYVSLFVIGYTVFLWIMASTIDFDYLKLLSGRLLMPIYLPALLLFFLGVSDLIQGFSGKGMLSRVVQVGAWGMIALLLAFGAKKNSHASQTQHSDRRLRLVSFHTMGRSADHQMGRFDQTARTCFQQSWRFAVFYFVIFQSKK